MTKQQLLQKLEQKEMIIEAFKAAIAKQRKEMQAEIDHWRQAFMDATMPESSPGGGAALTKQTR